MGFEGCSPDFRIFSPLHACGWRKVYLGTLFPPSAPVQAAFAGRGLRKEGERMEGKGREGKE